MSDDARRADWLAVDADGCIGLFRAGEHGALPKTVEVARGTTPRTWWPLQLARVARALEAGVGRFPPRSKVLAPDRAQRVVFVLDGAEAARRTYRDGATAELESASDGALMIVRESGPRVLATTEALSDRLGALASADGAVVSWMLEDALDGWLERCDDTGVYVWTASEPRATGLYERYEELPRRPIRADELPPLLARHLGSMPGVRFASSSVVQLADHFERAELVIDPPDAPLRTRRDPRGKDDRAQAERDLRRSILGAAALAGVVALVYYLFAR